MAYHELSAYTLTHESREFIHQHIVDAYGAQCATADEPPIRLVFSLIGLFLHVDRGLNGREVQRVHMMLANNSRDWPTLRLPQNRGTMTAGDVLAEPPGAARDRAIDAWCRSVWASYAENKPAVEALLRQHGVV
jgi:hypothetical protein